MTLVGLTDKPDMKKYTMLWRVRAVTFIFLLNGCSTIQTPSSWNHGKNAATKASHQEVLDELDRSSPRQPASALNELNVEFQDLRKVSPGKFEVYVFPKVSAQTNMEVSADEEYLGPPRIFEVSILAVNPCRQFIQEGLFGKLKPAEAFSSELATNPARHCAIMEIKDKKLATIDKGLLKQDDQLAVRIFIDDAYRIHATDHIIFETRNQNRVVRRLSDEEVSTPGLSYFPMELPAGNSRPVKTQVGKHFSKRLDPIAVHQIQKRYSRGFTAPQCDGALFSSKDPLGGKSEVGWCRGIPWPAYGENQRYFSVTQPLRVR